MPLWLIHLLALAMALALAEHWLRYALVERKRHRRVVDRLERIRRSRDRAWVRRQNEEWTTLLAREYSPEALKAFNESIRQSQAELARRQQGIIDDYNLDAAARGAAPWPSGLGLGQTGYDTGTIPRGR